MPRREHGFKREVLPDPLYNSVLVTKLINNIMLDGKKGVAQRIVYDAFEIVKEKTGADPLEQFQKALENIMPSLEVKAGPPRRLQLSGPDGGPARKTPDPRTSLADELFESAFGAPDERASRQRNRGRDQRPRRRGQEEGRHAQDGRSQQGLCTLPLVIPAAGCGISNRN